MNEAIKLHFRKDNETFSTVVAYLREVMSQESISAIQPEQRVEDRAYNCGRAMSINDLIIDLNMLADANEKID